MLYNAIQICNGRMVIESNLSTMFKKKIYFNAYQDFLIFFLFYRQIISQPSEGKDKIAINFSNKLKPSEKIAYGL